MEIVYLEHKNLLLQSKKLIIRMCIKGTFFIKKSIIISKINY